MNRLTPNLTARCCSGAAEPIRFEISSIFEEKTAQSHFNRPIKSLTVHVGVLMGRGAAARCPTGMWVGNGTEVMSPV